MNINLTQKNQNHDIPKLNLSKSIDIKEHKHNHSSTCKGIFLQFPHDIFKTAKDLY